MVKGKIMAAVLASALIFEAVCPAGTVLASEKQPAAEIFRLELGAAKKAEDGFEIVDGVLKKYSGSGGNVTIPKGVTSIGDKAFSSCRGLKNVTIPGSVKSIGEWAFEDCGNLTSVTIPGSVKSIGKGAFYCSGLTSVTISNGVKSIGDSAFWSCEDLKHVTIPDSVTSIGKSAFCECYSLEGITIPKGIKTIEQGVFWSCESIKSVTIPDSVTSVGKSAFGFCTGLKNVTIPYGVTYIGDRAFYGCRGLESVIIPDSVTSIGNEAIGYTYDQNTGEISKTPNFKIKCFQGSAAENYAKVLGIPYTLISANHTHRYGSWKIIKKATGKADGKQQRKCSICGKNETGTIISIGKTRISVPSKTYTGKQIKPVVTVKYGKTKLKEKTDYTVKYGTNKKVGKGTVTITGKGKYGGTITKTFTIKSGTPNKK